MLTKERQGLIEAFRAAGGEVASDSSVNLLTVNRQFTVKLVFSFYYRNAGGAWKVNLSETPVPDVVVLCRLNSNGTLPDYFLLPTQGFAKTIFRVQQKSRASVDVYPSGQPGRPYRCRPSHAPNETRRPLPSNGCAKEEVYPQTNRTQ